MSLGLDALNKLQRERAESAGGGTAILMHPAAPGAAGTNRLLAVGLILSLAVASFALLRSRSAPVILARAGDVAPQAAGAAAPAAVTFSVPNLAPTVPGQNALVTAYLAAGRVGGVDLRAGTGLGAVVMFNDALCHVNDVVNPVLGIRLVQIEPQRLTFADSGGVLYRKDIGVVSATP